MSNLGSHLATLSSYSKKFIEHCITWQLSTWKSNEKYQHDKTVQFLIERAELALKEVQQLKC
ncbi:MAG: hypothetical protein KIT27_05495 [Legionellales bacterium]|nr:hypothetical protein [Legionellales bacterium]